MREGNAASIMCSYNAVNGVPSCANKFLQNTIVREQWGFEGYIVSVSVSLQLTIQITTERDSPVILLLGILNEVDYVCLYR